MVIRDIGKNKKACLANNVTHKRADVNELFHQCSIFLIAAYEWRVILKDNAFADKILLQFLDALQ